MIVGVDFGAPQRARDQRRKIIAIAAHSTAWHSYRIDATGMNTRLLANDPPGWTAKELSTSSLARPARVVGFDFPFCVPHALLRAPKFASDVGYNDGRVPRLALLQLVRSRSGSRSATRSTSRPSPVARSRRARPALDEARDGHCRRWTAAAQGQVPGDVPDDAPRERAALEALGVAPVPRAAVPGGRGAGEIIEVYPGATLRTMGLASYKSRPDEAVRLGIAACAAAGIKLDVDLRLVALAAATARAPRRRPTTTWPTPSSRSALPSSTRRTAVARSSRRDPSGRNGS